MLKLDYDIMHSGDELKKLIAAHPDLPIVFEANDESNFGDYEVTICTSVHARIGEILDYQQDIVDDYIFTDREEFADCVQDYIYDTSPYDDRPDDYYIQKAKQLVESYEPYWKKCILVTIGN